MDSIKTATLIKRIRQRQIKNNGKFTNATSRDIKGKVTQLVVSVNTQTKIDDLRARGLANLPQQVGRK